MPYEILHARVVTAIERLRGNSIYLTFFMNLLLRIGREPYWSRYGLCRGILVREMVNKNFFVIAKTCG